MAPRGAAVPRWTWSRGCSQRQRLDPVGGSGRCRQLRGHPAAGVVLPQRRVRQQCVGPLSYFTWDSSTPLIDGHHWAAVEASVGEGTAFTVPEGVNQMRLALVVTADATEGQVWFDTVLIGTSPGILGARATDISVASTLYKDFLTTRPASPKCNFRDSGLRSQ